MKIGDTVKRYIGGTASMKLVITDLTSTVIICGSWTFDRKTGMEIDEDLDWGPQSGRTGSFIEVELE